MNNILFCLLFAPACASIFGTTNAIETPTIKIEVFFANGLNVSIPAINNITLFAFHGNVNKRIGSRDAGQISGDVRLIQNGRFTFMDDLPSLIPGDKIYYWTTVEHNGVHYHQMGEFEVLKFDDNVNARPYGAKYSVEDLKLWFPPTETETWRQKCYDYCRRNVPGQIF